MANDDEMMIDASIGELQKSDDDGDVRSFFLSKPVSRHDQRIVGPSVTRALEQAVALMEEKGVQAYLEFQEKEKELREQRNKGVVSGKETPTSISREGSPTGSVESNESGSKSIAVDPRSYQTALLEIAKRQNSIVHLGTGSGKTLIALLLIKEYAAGFAEGKQTVFLVPSVALAVQQSATLRSNLPYRVGKAHASTVKSEDARRELAQCDVLVATHGACLDLLNHYGDLFQVRNWNLLILDECHNCTGRSPYATIMENFYFRTPLEDRPRVLGLTASPLINVRKNHSDEQLGSQLAQLEHAMDAKIVSVHQLELGEDDEHAEILFGQAKEKIVYYSETPIPVHGGDWPEPGPGVHSERLREFKQLSQLCAELGPLPLALYIVPYLRELSRYSYDGETPEQFDNTKQYLVSLKSYCEQQCRCHLTGGRSDKLLALEELLEQEIEEKSPDGSVAAGVVFVQRRITALALNLYFLHRLETNLQLDKVRPVAKRARKGEHGDGSDSNASCTDENASVGGSSNSSEQFRDADEASPFEAFTPPSSFQQIEFLNAAEESLGGQFDDADSQDDSEVGMLLESISKPTDESSTYRPVSPKRRADSTIRSGALVRKTSRLFRSLTLGRGSPSDDDDDGDDGELQPADIRCVIDGLRRGDINVLIATAVVEEGVDVQACSFVAVFDSLTSIKSYIQMKGRARQQDAKFFLFKTREPDTSNSLSLDDAKAIESRVVDFISSQRHRFIDPRKGPREPEVSFTDESAEEEILAVQRGYYEASHGRVSLQTAKSLLYRCSLRQPLDPAVRTCKESLAAHLPLYDDHALRLTLPAYIGSSLRTICLPEDYYEKPKKERQSILALMACVRLYKNNLLTERLLPLSRKDIRAKILALTEEPRAATPVPSLDFPQLDNNVSVDIYYYSIQLESPVVAQAREALKSAGRKLAIVALQPLPVVPKYKQSQKDFGEISCSLSVMYKAAVTADELAKLYDFFATVMNNRWRRRKTPYHFRRRAMIDDSVVIPYIIGCVDPNDELDWAYMEKILGESKRTLEERTAVVRSLSDTEALAEPRVWSPLYDEFSLYISYGPSGQTCDAPFPHDTEDEDVKTFQDYYRTKDCHVPEDSMLFHCQRLWRLSSCNSPATGEERMHGPCFSEGPNPLLMCPNLKTVLLPRLACTESFLADAALHLECIVLPPFLYHLERHLTAKAFIDFCLERFPILGSCLQKESLEKIVGMLSAKSCAEDMSYETLEWFGDAVLQLVQTDAIMKSTELRTWIRNLHEGDLESVRSVMCCNDHLTSVCQSLHFDSFILTENSARGKWMPTALELYSISGGDAPRGKMRPPDKVCADVIEAVLGFVYLSGGYGLSLDVAKELQLTIPWDENAMEIEQGPSPQTTLSLKVKDFTGYENFRSPRLLQEAFNHPTAPSPGSSSYQRLEWVGDAVLSLAAREWIFRQYPEVEVGKMVLMETPLVANASLAFLSHKNGLHGFLNHRDPTLPSRIESYDVALRELGKGLWSTEPPKTIADIVESLLGAIHFDGGFDAGQKAAIRVIQPVLDLYTQGKGDVLTVHPKRSLLETGGGILAISCMSESNFAKKNEGLYAWSGSQLVPVNREGRKYVASIRCIGIDIVHAIEVDSTSAVNRACALVLTALEENCELSKRFDTVRSKLISGLSEITRSEESDSPTSQLSGAF